MAGIKRNPKRNPNQPNQNSPLAIFIVILVAQFAFIIYMAMKPGVTQSVIDDGNNLTIATAPWFRFAFWGYFAFLLLVTVFLYFKSGSGVIYGIVLLFFFFACGWIVLLGSYSRIRITPKEFAWKSWANADLNFELNGIQEIVERPHYRSWLVTYHDGREIRIPEGDLIRGHQSKIKEYLIKQGIAFRKEKTPGPREQFRFRLGGFPLCLRVSVTCVVCAFALLSLWGRFNLNVGEKIFSRLRREEIRTNWGHIVNYTIAPLFVAIVVLILFLLTL